MSRRFFVYDKALGKVVEVGEEWEPTPRPRVELMTGSCHEGQVAPDGTPIDSRRKREEYKRRAGVEDFDDARGLLQKTTREREKRFLGEQDIRPYREAAARAFHELAEGRRHK